VDPYDTQSAIALLRQLLEYEHVYDMAKLTVKNISKTQLVACMNPTAGSFEINPRLQRWFATFAIGLPETMSLHTIYLTFLTGHLKVGQCSTPGSILPSSPVFLSTVIYRRFCISSTPSYHLHRLAAFFEQYPSEFR
jgi:P-loop containing dynein motor region